MQFCKFYDDRDAGYIVDDGSDEDFHALSSDEDELNESAFFQDERKSQVDDFLAEMDKELNDTVTKKEVDSHLKREKKVRFTEKETNPEVENKEMKEEQKFYDDIYFDSDEDDEESKTDTGIKTKSKAKKKHPVLSNDELFYDPNIDDEDQQWVDNIRRSYQPRVKSSKKQSLPKTDAKLDCPACLTTLCLDCQRHEIYSTQFRAMFVQNCSVNFNQTLNYPLKSKGKKGQLPGPSQEVYHPVKCDICNTEVAVYDKDEVYHFYNVIPCHV